MLISGRRSVKDANKILFGLFDGGLGALLAREIIDAWRRLREDGIQLLQIAKSEAAALEFPPRSAYGKGDLRRPSRHTHGLFYGVAVPPSDIRAQVLRGYRLVDAFRRDQHTCRTSARVVERLRRQHGQPP